MLYGIIDEVERHTKKGLLYFLTSVTLTIWLCVISIGFGAYAYLLQGNDELPNRFTAIGVVVYALALAAYYTYGSIQDVIPESFWLDALNIILGAVVFLGSIPILYAVIPFMS